MWKGLRGMDVDLLKAIWNGVEMDMDPYVDPYVDSVAWISTLTETGPAALSSYSGIRSVAKKLVKETARTWWDRQTARLSARYRSWNGRYALKEPEELSLPRPILHRLLAIRTGHGDFAWYHRKFRHENAELNCSCGSPKTPEHLVLCRKVRKTFHRWPYKPPWPPDTLAEGRSYLETLITFPGAFNDFLEVTGFYSRICKR